MKKLILTFFFFLTLVVMSPISGLQAADSCSSITECNDKIAELEKKIADNKNYATTLAGQIAYYDDQIALSNLKVAQNEEIINSYALKIDTLEKILEKRSAELEQQIVQTYKEGEISPLSVLFSSTNVGKIIQKYKYLKILQTNTRQSLYDSQKAQSSYALQKTNTESAKARQEALKRTLAQQQIAKQALLAQTKNEEALYQKQLSEAIAQKSAISSFITSQGGASLLSNQTVCNDWGCYYNQRDSQWGNLTMGTSSDSLARYGCLVTSVAMVSSHYKKNIKPNDIAQTPSAFWSNTGYLNYVITVNGINISRSFSAVIDQQLAAGNPVIVGVYKGPAHFVVLKSGSKGDYVMYDPYVENGHDVKFTDHYPISSISYAGTLSFN